MTAILFVLLLLAVLAVAVLAVYTIYLRSRLVVERRRADNAEADFAMLTEKQLEILALKNRMIRERDAGIDRRERQLHQMREDQRVQRQLNEVLRDRVREGTVMMRAATEEIASLRADRVLVRTRELPWLSDIRKGVKEASAHTETARS